MEFLKLRTDVQKFHTGFVKNPPGNSNNPFRKKHPEFTEFFSKVYVAI